MWHPLFAESKRAECSLFGDQLSCRNDQFLKLPGEEILNAILSAAPKGLEVRVSKESVMHIPNSWVLSWKMRSIHGTD